jgi:predicted nucleotidyltransferase
VPNGDHPGAILDSLADAGVDFVVVGGAAAVMLGAPVTTLDVDIMHRRETENVAALLHWLGAHGAYHRFDLANRRLPATGEQLSGTGHVNLQTDLGKLDLLCELAPGEGYEQILADTAWMERGSRRVRVITLERLIRVKAAAGRPKDRIVLPILVATLEEQRKRDRP